MLESLFNKFGRLSPAFLLKRYTKSKLEIHSRKHIHGNTFVETHSNFEFYHLKMKQKSFESPIHLRKIVKCKNSNKKIHESFLVFGVKILYISETGKFFFHTNHLFEFSP